MTMEKLRLTLTVRYSLLIGGQTSSLLADVATARESGGAPIIPASAMKGALRIEFERLAAGLGKQVCHPGRPEDACRPSSLCLACRVFGSPGKEGKLRFQDARLDGDLRQVFTDERRPRVYAARPTGQGYAIRTGVAISRSRKVAEEDMLFASETISSFPMLSDPSTSPLIFSSEVEVWGTLHQEEWELLQLAAKSLQSIGADKSRGLGHLQARIEKIKEAEVTDAASGPEFSKDVIITLVPLEQLRVSGVKVTNNFLESLEFLPGGAVRGAMAKSFACSRGGWKHSAVREAFLCNPVLFSDFYPNVTSQPYLPKPVPLSARTCKAFPGFEHREATAMERASHGAKDILIPATVVKLLREQGIEIVLDDACEVIEDGKRCGAALKRLEGFYFSQQGEQASRKVPRRITTKTAINRSRFTSAEGQLYSYEVLDPRLECSEELADKNNRRLRFVGTVRGLTDELRKYLEREDILFIGGARFRGFGKVKIEKVQDLQEESLDRLKQRLDNFNSRIQPSLRVSGHRKAERLFFSLTLTSDLILPPGIVLDRFKTEVETALGLSEKNLEIQKALAGTDYRGGFNEALGIQKDLLPVVVRGSAFVFSCNSSNGGAEHLILQNLPKLLKKGLGCRCEEGFGMVSFCDSFHLDRMSQI